MTEPVPHWPGRMVSVGDHEVFVRSAPAGSDAERALCVHGLEGSSRNWTDLMDLLRTRLACDALDLPGFGESRPYRRRFQSVPALRDAIRGFLADQGVTRPHVAGNSLGGALSLELAASGDAGARINSPDSRTSTSMSPASVTLPARN